MTHSFKTRLDTVAKKNGLKIVHSFGEEPKVVILGEMHGDIGYVQVQKELVELLTKDDSLLREEAHESELLIEFSTKLMPRDFAKFYNKTLKQYLESQGLNPEEFVNHFHTFNPDAPESIRESNRELLEKKPYELVGSYRGYLLGFMRDKGVEPSPILEWRFRNRPELLKARGDVLNTALSKGVEVGGLEFTHTSELKQVELIKQVRALPELDDLETILKRAELELQLAEALPEDNELREKRFAESIINSLKTNKHVVAVVGLTHAINEKEGVSVGLMEQLRQIHGDLLSPDLNSKLVEDLKKANVPFIVLTKADSLT